MSTADAVLGDIPALEGTLPSVLIITAPYYKAVVNGMADGARAVLDRIEAEHETVEIAGAYELPQALRIAAAAERFDAFIVIGCVVKGETDHYDFICRAAMDGILKVALEHKLCLGTALLTVDTLAQAEARSGAEHNKGAEAAIAMLKQVALVHHLGRI
ncbi:6,7-dimethyl-8-ribityllumazine synthase [Acidisoma cellulosilytica]|uniref:6,7-dimethyl-8-ribityllumazine synthase n=1 Tax=Acidisoma cellulosilyticum TaxID=2802395 RepID=A0A964E6A6_9PROT|nr:6,7-dimethyl-8-ribityllumazine synthase [Acidisoma cellulosilyticum]MCB8882828.1 6,7-dimethyl-8-ribityllumazine synthase [Acidisoma cellulosilyticum]